MWLPPPSGTLWPCIWLWRNLQRIGNGVKPRLEDVWKALEILEPNVPIAHQEAVGPVTWMFLAASLEVRNQAQRVRQLQCQEEVLEKWLVATECMLPDPDESLPSSQSGSLMTTPWQA